MSVTQITNNQIQDYAITGSKLSNNMIYGSNLSVTGGITCSDINSGGNIGISNVTISGNASIGNVLSNNYLWANGQPFIVDAYSNANVNAFLPTYSGILNASLYNGNGGGLSNIQYGNIIGAYSNANVGAYLPSYTGTFTASSVSVSGNVTSSNVNGNNFYSNGVVSATGNVRGGNINTAGNITGASLVGAIATASQPSITSVGTLTFLAVSGNAVAGNFNTAGIVSATGNVTAVGNINSSSYFNGNGSQLTGLYANANVASYLPTYSGNLGANNVTFTGSMTVLGNVSIPGNISQISGNSGQFFGNVLGFGALYAGIPSGYNSQPDTIFQASANANEFAQINLQNINTGNAASGDYVVTGDIGTNLVNFIDLGFASSTYSAATANALGNLVGPTDGYLYVRGNTSSTPGGNLIIGAATTGRTVSISAGGGNTNNLVMNLAAGQVNVVGNISATGNVNATGNIVGQNLLTSGAVSATGNITGNNLLVNGGANILGNLNVQGNITFINSNVVVTNDLYIELANNQSTLANINGAGLVVGNTGTAPLVTWQYSTVANAWQSNVGIVSSGPISAVGNVTGQYLIGNGAFITGSIGNGSSNVNGANGSFSGTVTAGNLSTTGTVSATTVSASGTVTGASLSGTIITASQPNITSVGTLTTLNVSGAVSASGNVTSNYFIGNGSQLTGLYANANVAAYLPTYSGALTASSVSATGNIAGSYILGNGALLSGLTSGYSNVDCAAFLPTYTGNIVALTGNVNTTAGISATGNIRGSYILGNGSQLTGLPAGYANANVAAYLPSYGGAVSVSGITNSNANGVGNIGSSSTYFNTVFAQSTSALYADVAEDYLADAQYAPGTVLSFGGEKEVTLSVEDMDTAVAGVVSTNPAYHMNSGLEGEYVATLALLGRVPCQVIGPVKKGDRMVSAPNGYARAEKNPVVGTIIGKALESFDGNGFGTIEIVVGRV